MKRKIAPVYLSGGKTSKFLTVNKSEGVGMRKKISIKLEQSPDRWDLWDVTEIMDKSGPVDNCCCTGMLGCDRLEIGSWIRKREEESLKRKNKNITFIKNQPGEAVSTNAL